MLLNNEKKTPQFSYSDYFSTAKKQQPESLSRGKQFIGNKEILLLWH